MVLIVLCKGLFGVSGKFLYKSNLFLYIWAKHMSKFEASVPQMTWTFLQFTSKDCREHKQQHLFAPRLYPAGLNVQVRRNYTRGQRFWGCIIFLALISCWLNVQQDTKKWQRKTRISAEPWYISQLWIFYHLTAHPSMAAHMQNADYMSRNYFKKTRYSIIREHNSV